MMPLSLAHLLDYDFIRNALIAGTIVAITAGIVGYFVVLRGLSFAGHALSHVGFAGATGAVALGVPAVFGLLAFALLGAAGMGAMGERARGRDVAIGIVLAWSLGLGVLFLSLYKGYATEAYSLLFGEILGISVVNVIVTAIVSGIALAALGFLYRPLLFSSVDPHAALARGVARYASRHRGAAHGEAGACNRPCRGVRACFHLGRTSTRTLHPIPSKLFYHESSLRGLRHRARVASPRGWCVRVSFW